MLKKIAVILIVSILFVQISFADNDFNDLYKEHFIEMNRKMKTVRIMAVGDIMMHMPIVNNAYKEGRYSFEDIFQSIKPILNSADLVIGNLETTLTSNTNLYSGYPRFHSPISLIDALKKSGFDILTTANNHALDGGTEGVHETINQLDIMNMAHTGTFLNESQKPVIIKSRQLSIGIAAYTYSTNGLAPEKEYFINYIDKDKIKKDYEWLIEKGTDIQLISLHWGTEYQYLPNAFQKDLESYVKELGFDVLLGSHPHVLQESIENEDYFAIYSMGNFLSNQRDNFKDLGVIVDLTIEKTQDGIVVKKVNMIPTWVDKYQNGILDYKIVRIDSKSIDLDSGEKNHIEILNKHFDHIFIKD